MRPGVPILLFALLTLPAQATLVRAMSFDDKVENASSIFLGRCVEQQSQWDAARKWILTYSTFRIEKTFKGAPAQEITIVTPGGTVGTIAQEVVGVPRFRKGHEHVLFVRGSEAGPTVLYFDQGAYDVRTNDRGERIIEPIASPAAVIDDQRGVALSPERARTLRDFEGLVRQTVQRREAIRMEMLERQQKEEASIWNQLRRNRALVILALIGAALATWQLVKRT